MRFSPLLPRVFMLCVAFCSAIALSSAMLVEHVLKWQPCILCVYERIPWMVLGVIAFLSVAGRLSPLTVRWGVLGVVFTCAIGMVLSIYHIGVEESFWSFQACSGAVQGIESIAELMEGLDQSFRPSCADVPWRLFGVSLSGYNAIVSLGLCLLGLDVYNRSFVCRKEQMHPRPEERS